MIIETNSAKETYELGFKIGKEAKKGQVYTMVGDLGVGKTVFTQGMADGLEITEPISSPTFTIVQVYDEGRLPFYHFDVYRIGDISEMDEIGYEDYIYGEGVSLIEWANLIEEILPDNRIEITIEKDLEKGFDYRKITIEERGVTMRILALDSSGLVATVAILEDEQTIAEYTVNYKKTHSQTLLPMLDEIVKMTEFDLATIDAIAVAGGPGSFTGLRIGSATAKGLGLALKKPLIHIPTLDGMAYNLFGNAGIICPIMDARRNQVYTGLYRFENNEFVVVEEQMAISVDELIKKLNQYGETVTFLGDGVPVYKEKLEDGLNITHYFAPAHMNRQRASAVGALGMKYFAEGKIETAMEHQPDYLRLSQAERERAEKEKMLSFREITEADIDAVASLEKEVFSDVWTSNSIYETFCQNQAFITAAEEDGEIVGYCIIYYVLDEGEIARIAVAPDRQRRGAGRSLLDYTCDLCREKGVSRLMLDVRESNEPARKFYENFGFSVDGIRRNFYEMPAEHAVLMSKTIG